MNEEHNIKEKILKKSYFFCLLTVEILCQCFLNLRYNIVLNQMELATKVFIFYIKKSMIELFIVINL